MDWIIKPMDNSHLPGVLELEKKAFPDSKWPASMLFCEINLNSSGIYYVALTEEKGGAPGGKKDGVDKILKDILKPSEKDEPLDKLLKNVISSQKKEIPAGKLLEDVIPPQKKEAPVDKLLKDVIPPQKKEDPLDKLVKEVVPPVGTSRYNKVIGYGGMWLKLRQAHITTLAVDEAYRKKGIAISLILKLLKEAIKAKAGHAILEVKKTNLPAQKLYKKLGFKVLGTRKNYYIEDRDDGVVMFLENLKGKKVKKMIENFGEMLDNR